MKKNFFFWMAAIVMLIMSSCQQEAGFGTEATVSFQVGTPEIATRAYSDGKTATVLQYAVYDAEGNELTDLTKSVENKNAETIDISAIVNLQLTTGNTYSVIFWAAAEGAPYEVDFANKTMTVVDYSTAVSNDESRDAFYKHHTFTVTGAQTEVIELRRPFAQLNIGTSDYAASTSAGYTPTQSKVVVRNIYNTLNLATGEVDKNNPVEVTYDYADIKKDETFPVAGYEYLAMNYLLVAADKAIVDVEFSYRDEKLTAKTRTVGSVPVQRNHRTNIYGQLLTSDVVINVEIKPEYDKYDYNNEGKLNDYVAFTAAELQALLDKEATGEIVINLGADIKGDVVDFQKADRHIVIEGCGKKYDGTIRIHNNSNHNNGSITVKNINFETSTASVNFIEALENGSERYSNNITVDGCTFTAIDAAENTAVGVQAKSSKNLRIFNCAATGVHSLVQAQSCDEDVIVKNATIKGKNGVAFKQVKNAVVEGSKIEAVGYGIRFDGNTDNYAITVKDNDVKAVQPFIVRKMIGANNTITLEGENTLTSTTTETPAYQIIITNGDDEEEYVAPTGSYTLTGAEKYVVYPALVYKDKTYYVYSAYGLVELSGKKINGGEKVVLESNIDLEGIEFNGLYAFNSENNNTFDGQGKTVSNWTNNSGAADMGFIKQWVGTIKNVNFENCHLKTAGRSAIVAGKVYSNIENVHVNNCSIEDSYWTCGIIAGLYNSGNVTNCTVTNSSVKSNGGTGGIVGVINETGGERSLVNCSVSNSTINNTGIYGAPYTGGALVGMFNVDGAVTYKFVGCSVSNNTLKGDFISEKYPENENVVEE